jgi:cytosine/adenosine deaminase-related metal-dependent hydrolase
LSYQKFHAQQLFNGYGFLSSDTVLVTQQDGTVEALITLEDAGLDVQKVHGILTPGFINAHCHLELSHLKNAIAEHTGLVEFLLAVVKQRNHPQEVIQAAIISAEEEMIHNGIVAVGDICNGADTLLQKQQHRLAYHNFIEVSAWNPAVAAGRFNDAVQLAAKFSSISRTSICPHAPYSVSNDLWNLLGPTFINHIITIHNQETKAEEDLFRHGNGNMLHLYETLNIPNSHFKPSGLSSLQTVLPFLKQAQQLLLVHNTFTSKKDIEAVTTQFGQSVFFCLCPNANRYIENTLPPAELLIREQCNVVLGTDSLASNHQLSIAAEMQLLHQQHPSIAIEQLLQWATLNGAKALQMENSFGSFEKGKKPGIVSLDTSTWQAKRLL